MFCSCHFFNDSPIEIKKYKFIFLNLSINNLTIFPDVFHMKELEYLILEGNHIEDIPDDIGLLTKL